MGRAENAALSDVTLILPARARAGRAERSVATTGVVIAVLVEYAMNGVSFWFHVLWLTSAESRAVFPSFSVVPAEPTIASLSGGSESSPRAGPSVKDEPTLSVARNGLSKDCAGIDERNQL